jgi:hypothetical protein
MLYASVLGPTDEAQQEELYQLLLQHYLATARGQPLDSRRSDRSHANREYLSSMRPRVVISDGIGLLQEEGNGRRPKQLITY